MTRPEIVRADTIDLQDHHSPSAKDHSRQPTQSNAAIAPHQAETLREAAAEAYEEQNGGTQRATDWNSAEAQLMQHFNGESMTADEMESSLDHGHQDALAVAQNGGMAGDDDDLADGEADDGMDDDFNDKISSSPSIDDEDIDFEFVYALHTFVASVDGQANAIKGDTMVLLDDSNSYWWLVRVVKDSSIGYLPAEHIETPTERLARLNKHRNIDLSQAMLGDPGEKSKNPIKKVMRRRNAKTVTFAAPTYVEASDIDYSTDEDDMDGDFFDQEAQQAQQEQKAEQQQSQQQQQQLEATQSDSEDDEVAPLEPTRQRAEIREVRDTEPRSSSDSRKASSEALRHSDEIFDNKTEPSKSRNGTVRNTDSFYKDETVETRKITLTPNLLRDDGPTARTSNDSRDYKPRQSLDKDKDREDKLKEDKKKKEKKSGMLSGLFKRKDKKSRNDEDPDELIYGKRSLDRASPVPSKDSEELVSEEQPQQQQAQITTTITGPQRQPSKLQKQPKQEQVSPTKGSSTPEPRPSEIQTSTSEKKPSGTVQPSMRLVQAERELSEEPTRELATKDVQPEQTPVQDSESKSTGSFTEINHPASSAISKPEQVKAATTRMDFDDDSGEEITADDIAAAPVNGTGNLPDYVLKHPPHIPGAFPDSVQPTPASEKVDAFEERLSESPVQISPVDANGGRPPALVVDTSSQEEPPSPASSASPELGVIEDINGKRDIGRGASGSPPVWNDSNLRTFFEDDADIKDLLVVVYDKSGVAPAGPDHPVTGGLFKEENAKIADITSRLDNLLGDWLARKGRSQSR